MQSIYIHFVYINRSTIFRFISTQQFVLYQHSILPYLIYRRAWGKAWTIILGKSHTICNWDNSMASSVWGLLYWQYRLEQPLSFSLSLSLFLSISLYLSISQSAISYLFSAWQWGVEKELLPKRSHCQVWQYSSLYKPVIVTKNIEKLTFILLSSTSF